MIPPAVEATHGAGLGAVLTGLSNDSALAQLPEVMERLELISLRAVMEFFLSTEAITSTGTGRSTEGIINALGAAPRHHWLVRRWLVALVERQLLSLKHDQYYWQKIPMLAGSTTVLPEVYSMLGFPPEMAKCHQKLLAHLPELITDETSINQLIFEDGKILAALAAYQNNWFTTYLNHAIAFVIKQAIKPGSMLKVLELGGGTGLTTSAILNTLAGRPINYRFTDVSPLFTTSMQQQYRHHIGLRCSLLDINIDFSTQSVPHTSVDVVVAGNALHNAADISQALRHIRNALHSGGWLLFSESTRENHAMLTAMQFLLSPANGVPLLGSEDRRAGTDQVFINTAAWQQELTEAGFALEYTLPSLDSPLVVAGQTMFFAIAV